MTQSKRPPTTAPRTAAALTPLATAALLGDEAGAVPEVLGLGLGLDGVVKVLLAEGAPPVAPPVLVGATAVLVKGVEETWPLGVRVPQTAA